MAETGGENNKKNNWWREPLFLFSKLSVWIITPVLIGVLAGKWLDVKYGTEPWLFLASVGAAFVLSIIGLIINATKEFNKIDKEAGKNKDEQSDNRKNF